MSTRSESITWPGRDLFEPLENVAIGVVDASSPIRVMDSVSGED